MGMLYLAIAQPFLANLMKFCVEHQTTFIYRLVLRCSAYFRSFFKPVLAPFSGKMGVAATRMGHQNQIKPNMS